jgi:two-component system chemotaxis response regulator CheY
LIVEDVLVIRKVAAAMMANLGFQTREAESAEQALVLAAAHAPDVILLDWNLPEMSGIDFLLKLRKSDGGDRPKVIFCSGHDSHEDICEALARGADEYIMKPFDDQVLAMKIVLLGLV